MTREGVVADDTNDAGSTGGEVAIDSVAGAPADCNDGVDADMSEALPPVAELRDVDNTDAPLGAPAPAGRLIRSWCLR